MSQGNDRPQPEGNGVTGHPILTLSRGNEQPLNTWTVMLRPGQVFTKGPDRREQQFVLVISNKVVKGRHQELKERVRYGRILGLSHEGRKKEGIRLPTAQVTNLKGKAV